jgi:hypothetical protein
MFTITFQIAPPLKVSGDWVRRLHISASFSFQVFFQGELSSFSKYFLTQA